jgi:hypothetical protein
LAAVGLSRITVGLSAGRRRRRAAPDPGTQVDVSHHTLSDQELVDGTVYIGHVFQELALNDVLDQEPGLVGELCTIPLLDQ